MRRKETFGFVVFGLAMLLAIFFFEYRTHLLEAFEEQRFRFVLIPYCFAVLTAAALGARLTSWYVESSGIFEVFAVPLIIGLVSVFLTGQVVAVSGGTLDPENHLGTLETLQAGLYCSVLFLSVAGIALAIALFISSVTVRWFAQRTWAAHAV